jgi:hypothetical protein
MSQPILKLVWVNEGILVAQKNTHQPPPKPKEIEQPPRGGFLRFRDWLNRNGAAIGTIEVALVIVGLIWMGSGTYSRFVDVEETIKGGVDNKLRHSYVEPTKDSRT